MCAGCGRSGSGVPVRAGPGRAAPRGAGRPRDAAGFHWAPSPRTQEGGRWSRGQGR
ncbi:hypothetical protein HMPREF1317_0245 [Schaalia georgiae F0490]|uniref:Uncharacterized protein n=1 Tax=Schaalia georgiae F0490 TaxID=1125717 RepID=J0XGM1_9ACTO|nr:hypothetical protein HMPREF1317_0245 [Schaalia georgiae F0490]